jgi:hypothetical protein
MLATRVRTKVFTMIEVRGEDDDLAVLISNKDVEILDVGEGYILAQCDLSDLASEQSQPLPKGLALEVRSEDGFGTFSSMRSHCLKLQRA